MKCQESSRCTGNQLYIKQTNTCQGAKNCLDSHDMIDHQLSIMLDPDCTQRYFRVLDPESKMCVVVWIFLFYIVSRNITCINIIFYPEYLLARNFGCINYSLQYCGAIFSCSIREYRTKYPSTNFSNKLKTFTYFFYDIIFTPFGVFL